MTVWNWRPVLATVDGSSPTACSDVHCATFSCNNRPQHLHRASNLSILSVNSHSVHHAGGCNVLHWCHSHNALWDLKRVRQIPVMLVLWTCIIWLDIHHVFSTPLHVAHQTSGCNICTESLFYSWSLQWSSIPCTMLEVAMWSIRQWIMGSEESKTAVVHALWTCNLQLNIHHVFSTPLHIAHGTFHIHPGLLSILFTKSSGDCQSTSKTGSVLDVQVPAELWQIYEGSLKGNVSLLNAWVGML